MNSILAPGDADAMQTTAPIRPIFVMGSPRSGTTLVGAFVGSANGVSNFGELGIFYFSIFISRREYRRVETPLKERYFESLEKHAAVFASEEAIKVGSKFFCDTLPWNLRIGADLAKKFPEAIFILVLRHYSGVIQSLQRSHADGWAWAGPTDEDRAEIWTSLYSHAQELPSSRTVPISYDALCENPAPTIGIFKSRLEVLGVPMGSSTYGAFVQSHATTARRPTLGSVSTEGFISLSPIRSFDQTTWRSITNGAIVSKINKVESILRGRFPEYVSPSSWS